jgi:hypothetical protein
MRMIWRPGIIIVKLCPVMKPLPRYLALLLLLLLSMMLLACGRAAPAGTLQAATPLATAALPTETIAPTASPTPESPLVILLAPAGADRALVEPLQAYLDDQAIKAGLRFQVRPELSPQEMENVKVVVALPPTNNLGELAAASSQTSFLAVNYPELAPSANLSVINLGSQRPDQVGFLAGFTAAEITTDWRAGILTAAGSPAGEAMRQGFVNGVFYFCGLCLPVYAPFPNTGYPITLQIPTGGSAADQQAAINQLRSWQVSTVFVDPAIADEALLDQLAQADIHFILAAPPPQQNRASWVASVGFGDSLQAVAERWPGLLEGESGASSSLPLGFTETNPDLLSPGRQHLAEEMLGDLHAGFIDTGVDPAVWQGQ